ncbi:MAG: peptidase [Epsilonproteobacteria bacterium]|nr:peptidase [Campylobacterota bacterium]
MKQQYKSYQETVDFLKECVRNYPNIITLQNIGTTWEEREIVLATITINVEQADLKPALLYTGTVHAREWIGNELGVEFIDHLLKNHQSDPRITSALTKNTLYIVPCLNPDGFEYSRTHFSFWRKNRRNNKNGTYGVDLNRNFSVGYVKTTDTSSNVYSGPEPFSEPETRAIKEFVDTHENITVALDYHSQGNVFFPAHKFNHEAEVNGTDLNVLCANMNYEIKKVSGRKYGIHRGKPPTKLISGSGREYYYSKGIISAVVEVGTRNIPDYMQNMKESINENIPALLHALGEAQNYSFLAPKRVENFHLEASDSQSISLAWDGVEGGENIFYKIYKNTQEKQACNEANLIATTKNKHFTDTDLKSGKLYFYYIRAVDMISNIESPYAPKVRAKTALLNDEFSRVIFPTPNNIGYIAEKTIEQNREHFGTNSLFVGVNENKGISYAVMEFSLENIPENAIIQEANISLYPMNRVNAKIEKYGEWSLSFIDQQTIGELYDFSQIHNAQILGTLGESIPSEKLTQGIWSHWHFNAFEAKLLQSQIHQKSVVFRMQGPTKLPVGRNSQMMMFDIGYGKFGGGIHYRPSLNIKYTVPSTQIEIKPNTTSTISTSEIQHDTLICGFDKNGCKEYGYMEFDLSSLPNPDETVVTHAYIEISNKKKPTTKQDMRYNIEFIDVDNHTFEDIKNRERIEFIGYEVSKDDLIKNRTHHFLFDSFSRQELEESHKQHKPVSFIVKATSSSIPKNHQIEWDEKEAKLIIQYIKRRKYGVPTISNLQINVEKGMVKLAWENPKDEAHVGSFVVRNRFHPPQNPYDGVKLYAGPDNYTYDNYGSTKVDKYYAVFTYDDVPNYSEPIVIEYKVK